MKPSDKAIIRAKYLKMRSNIPKEKQKEASMAVCEHILTLDLYQNAQNIALYQTFNGEVDLTMLWEHAQASGKTCLMPVCTDTNSLHFLPTTSTTPQEKNHYGILEPDLPVSDAISIDNIDLMLAPTVAFDTFGKRLGMGAGFYDKALKLHRPQHLLSVAYECQLHPNLTQDPWDVLVDGIVTEKTIYWSKS